MKRFRLLTALVFIPLLAPVAVLSQFQHSGSIPAVEARQGVAVDKRFIYAVHSRQIGKYDKKTGRRVGGWKGEETGPVLHLDSGMICRGKLYCAHSNYPDLPMTSSVEIWDARTMKHTGSHSFGVYRGSCTWVDRYQRHWWAGFAQYEKWKPETGKGTEWTSIVKLDDRWNELAAWTLPDTVIALLRPMSNSGGSWGPDGFLYLTGHDRPEMYVLALPEAGSVLRLVKIVAVPFEGQGIAWDRSEEGFLWGIRKEEKKVIKAKLNKED